MSVFKEGDFVSVLNEAIYGYVKKISGKNVLIVDLDGFERNYFDSVLVHAKSEDHYNITSVPRKGTPANATQKISKPHSKSENRIQTCPEIDLHFEALENDLKIVDLNQILQKQLTACRSFLKNAINAKYKRVVLIHGKGEGVLKAEIHLYLQKIQREQGISLTFKDADPSEYGMGGATEVNFIF